MSTTEMKSDLLKKIQSLDNTSIEKFYNKILTILNDEIENEEWSELSEEEKIKIENGLAQSERGEVFAHEDVMKFLHSRIRK